VVEQRALASRTMVSGRPRLEHEHGVDPLLAALPAPTTAASRTPGTRSSSTRSTSSGKTFSPSGVTIISFLRPLDEQATLVVHLADVAGVQPAVLERLLRRTLGEPK
jgi:hypothetical protein